LLIRYSTTKEGKLKKKALVYQRDEHGIQRSSIAPDALRIIERLRANGHSAFVVGGAVRDLLVGKKPKDFDIVTDATPGRIKKIFWNSRIIGKRFRLVHVFFEKEIFEVCTFRSLKEGTVGNSYGTMDEDVLRRDFTLNALYYDPRDEIIVDYVGGVEDVRRGLVKPLIPLKVIFKEDPVRMIRAAKYSAMIGFRLSLKVKLAIRREAKLLSGVSSSRLSEEIAKILGSGKAVQIVTSLIELKLLSMILPNVDQRFKTAAGRQRLLAALAQMDEAIGGAEESRLGRQLSFLLEPMLETEVDWSADPLDAYREAFAAARDALNPMNPPRVELECAVRFVFRRKGIPLMQKHIAFGDEREGRGRRRARGPREARP
jgi:poly(A) polymerase